MPIYEFYSPDTHTVYSFFARSPAVAARGTPLCPGGGGFRMERRISRFAVIGARKTREEKPDSPAAPGSEPDDALFAGLEKEFAGIDEDNPDPRRLGSLMRRACEMSGEKLDEQTEEMVRRLESGERVDKIEEMMGGEGDETGYDPYDDGDPYGAPPPPANAEGETAAKEAGPVGRPTRAGRNLLRRLARAGEPRIDSTLYDYAEWLQPSGSVMAATAPTLTSSSAPA